MSTGSIDFTPHSGGDRSSSVEDKWLQRIMNPRPDGDAALAIIGAIDVTATGNPDLVNLKPYTIFGC